ncbi:MAG TPA: peptidylprolyl isomerase, partial [Candidatus Kapabacteria bacterium]
AARSEQEWRVKVSILNALSRMPRMNSTLLDIIRRTVDAVSTESLLTEHTANAALMTLDAMTAAGKLSLSDSLTVRDWLHTFKTENELYSLMPLRIRAQAMVTLSRLEKSIEVYRGMTDIYTYRHKGASTIVTQGFGVAKDTTCFKQLLMRLLQSPESEMHPSLEALNVNWQLAKKDSVYMNELAEEKLSSAYRKLLIRLPSQFADPAIVTSALEYIQDSSIIADSSLRIEANDYTSQYIERFSSREFFDQLHSILQAVRWLKPSGTDIVTKVRKLYERASTEWSDKALADSARVTLKALGSDVEKPLTTSIRKSNINWELLENSPDTILVQYAPEFMFIKLDKYNAPLTCLNMIKLFKDNYFAQNYFHRVVPNFVIQGGDRTATGFGGPGYSIRREISNVYYDEIGVVGMASSGKDTEGSQWFATHVPTPHLNSRYTIWGKIVQGFGALNTIQRYDKVDNIIPYQ